jgi:hypothetical protein
MGEERARQRVVNVDMLEIYSGVENLALWARSEFSRLCLEVLWLKFQIPSTK